MLAGQTQNGNRKKKREREKTEKKKINIKQRIIQKKFKPCASLARKQQAAMVGEKKKEKKKEASRGFNIASNVCL